MKSGNPIIGVMRAKSRARRPLPMGNKSLKKNNLQFGAKFKPPMKYLQTPEFRRFPP
jgi:hypothetical protein